MGKTFKDKANHYSTYLSDGPKRNKNKKNKYYESDNDFDLAKSAIKQKVNKRPKQEDEYDN